MAGIDAFTVLMLHCDGSDGSTTITDASQYAHQMTARGNAALVTAYKKFGTAGLNCDGSGDRVTTPDSADWDFGSGDFTIDFWIRPNDNNSDNTLIGQWSVAGGNGSWYVQRNSSNQIQFVWRDASVGQLSFARAWGTDTNTFQHIAIVRSGSSLMAFVNGAKQGSSFSWAGTMANSPSQLTIGAFDGGGSDMNAQMDEIRISKGIARWTSDFTPPTSAYTTGTTYSDTPSGGVLLGGSVASDYALDLVRSGGVALGGSVTTALFKAYTDAPSGGIVLGGSASQSLIRANTPSGGIVFGGSVVLGPVKLTVRLLSGTTEIANWQHVIAGSQARVSWTQFQVPLPLTSVVRAVVGKAKLTLRAKSVGLNYVYVATFGKAKLTLKGKAVRAVQPTSAQPGKASVRLKGKPFILRQTQRAAVGKPKLILRTKPIARAGVAGLTPSPPRALSLAPSACQDEGVLVPTAPKSTLLVPTAKRSI